MRRTRVFAAALLLASACLAQRLNPVKWSLAVEPATVPPGSRVLARLTATMDPGWHLYSLTTPRPPIATTLQLAPQPAIQSFKVYQPRPARKLDPNFKTETETFEKEVTFLLEIQLATDAPAGVIDLTVQPRFQACDDRQCLPPRRVSVTSSLTVDPAARAAAVVIPAGYSEAAPPPSSSSPTSSTPSSQGLVVFLVVAFGFGLAAIFTPCVFPMIPITVSFFLNKPAASRGRTVGEAVLFSAGIVILFTALGLIATAALGPFGVVQLGSNPWVNGFIALVFFAFGLSLLGAFEITIPSSVLTRLDRASQGGGVFGTLLMGLTFSLTAFACVGPFVGTLLAASVQQGGPRPALGMAAFAGGLASPFFFLALFPAWLKRMPRSGGWLERVKVVMGFLILAAMFKYLSAVDQVLQWNVLTRERFLAAWIVLIAMAGLYLLGLLRLAGVKPDEPVGLVRLLIGALLLVFAISLVPGMFGARLGELDAFVPAAQGPGLLSGAAGGDGGQWMKNQYREALAKAREEGRAVLVSFTGYACTNCHWMKANMFTRPEIAAAMKDFVLLELYTDGADAASEENQKLQESRFQTVAIPYYAILSADEKV
ncbi:MAG: cytochrome c biogenesis protein CcdA, partial [Acidobacteriota bacterium]